MVDDGSKFQVTYSKEETPFMNFEDWKNVFSEKDSIVLNSPFDARMDCSGESYTLHLPLVNTPMFSCNEKMGSNKDFLGNSWGDSCCSGPVVPSESKSYCLC